MGVYHQNNDVAIIITGTKLMCGILGKIVYQMLLEFKCLHYAHIIHDVIHFLYKNYDYF